jgi:L-histidine N-alpha-methyltransferase
MPATPTRLADRLEIIDLPHAAAANSFADDVRAGLTAEPKRLASKYFYDDLGSALFDAITRLPEYYLTRAETQILREWGWDIVRALDANVEFLELGSGSAAKTRLLIEEALRVQGSLRYSPIDISREALESSSAALVGAYPKLSVRAYAGDYFAVLSSKVLRFERRVLAMLMGSNIGNYQPDAAREFVALIGRALRPGDGLLLGTDLKKDRRVLEAAYDDPTGVTAAFDKNVLGRINRELGGTFDLTAFEHVARYDERRGSVDSFLRSKKAQRVRVEAIGLDVAFAEGETIHTESSYKFDEADIEALAAAGNFSVARIWHDARRAFGVSLLMRKG